MANLMDRPRISVVIPMYNEADSVATLFARLFPVLDGLEETYEVICIDDGSTDRTAVLLHEESRRRPRLVTIRQTCNRGQHAATLNGLVRARGEWIITLDADLQNPPEEIPRLVDALRRGHDLVGTYRHARHDSSLRLIASRLTNRVVRGISHVEVRDLGCMMRGYSDAVAAKITRDAGKRDFIPLLGPRYATNPIEMSIRHEPRVAGRSRYTLTRLVQLAIQLARTVANSQSPQSKGARR